MDDIDGTDRLDLRDVLRDQNGSLTRRQASRCGLSSTAVARRLTAGDWESTLPGVLRATDHADDDRERIRRAGLWAGETGTVVGTGAAAWWHLDDTVPERIPVARPMKASGRPPAGVRLRRIAIPDEDRLRVDGIRVTKRPRTVVDAAVELGALDGARLMDRALQNGAVALDSMHDAVDRRGQAWGAPLARELMELAEGGARSRAERLTVRALRRAGLRDVALNHRVMLAGWGPAELDIAFLAKKVVVEVDGWAFHRDVDRFRRDARRQNALMLAGWVVLRVTWYDIRHDPDAVVAAVVAALTLTSR